MDRCRPILGDMALRAFGYVHAFQQKKNLSDKPVMQYKRHIPSLLQCSEAERDGLARILKEVLVRYDNLFR